jgi:two-component system repressor protein LuxO
LFYRLYVVPIELPPLRQRGDDVVLIARELLVRYASEDGKQLHDFSPDVLAAFRNHAWPGNVRELVNAIRAVVALHDGPMVQLDMLPLALRNPVQDATKSEALAPTEEEVPWFAQSVAPAAPALREVATTYDPAKVRALADMEREAVDYALRAFGGNVAQAALALQINPSTLYRKIQVWTAQGGLQAGRGA